MKLSTITSKLHAWSDPCKFVIKPKAGPLDSIWSANGVVAEETFSRFDGDEARSQLDQAWPGIKLSAHDTEKLTMQTREFRIHPSGINLAVAMVSAPGIEPMWVFKGQTPTWTVVNADEAGAVIDKYKQLRKGLFFARNGAASIRLVGKVLAAGLAVYLGLAAIGAYFDSSRGTLAAAPESAAAKAMIAESFPQTPAAPAGVPPSFPKTAYLTEQERAKVSASAKIQVSKSGPSLVVFSDPNCPFCQRLEATLGDFDKKAAISVIPVGYKSGSKELAAAVLCAKDPAAAWKTAITYGKSPGPVCAEGLKKIELNNQLFESLNLTSTPTLVSPKGLMLNGALQAQELDVLLQN